MPTKWEFTRTTKAGIQGTPEYFTHPEDPPKLNLEAFKQINVKERQGNTVIYEMQAEMMGRKLTMVAKQTLDRDSKKMTAEILDGDSKGSVMVVSMTELPDNAGTELKYTASLELGALGFLAKGR
jgi:hypothetical protein